MILSILICTIPRRRDMFDRIMLDIRGQVLKSGVEIEVLADNGEGSVGVKRQRMIEAAQGDYVCFIDDDDQIAPIYVSSILTALSSAPDVVGFCGIITTNGRGARRFKISKDCNYEEKRGVYYRYNNHLCPVKRSIALQVGYKDMSHEEDYDYATRLQPFIKTEVFIDQNLYFYKYLTNKK